jgi:hypothetical protein
MPRPSPQNAEVDPEMVRACLRVLKHHNVVALVDMFFYSNRYEPTGKQLDQNLLQDVIWCWFSYVLLEPDRGRSENFRWTPRTANGRRALAVLLAQGA